MLPKTLTISCLCGKARQEVTVLGAHDPQQLRASWHASRKLCHCHACRHMSGILCTSFLPVVEPSQNSLGGLASYSSTERSISYFCPTCGCHVFACTRETPSSPGDEDTAQWAVATGTIVGCPTEPGPPSHEPISELEWDWIHDGVSSTKDGGLSIWINPKSQPPSSTTTSSSTITPESAILPASCHCGTVRYHITRPDSSSTLPHSPFPDLTVPFCDTDPNIVKNPSDVKWWLRPGHRQDKKTRYLAGTCACRSCRLASGFEIQTWAFVPRSNIFIYSTSPHTNDASPRANDDQTTPQQLDFETIPPSLLTRYQSSPDVFREFCPRCGASVFWHNAGRPELIDVSAGLLEAADGGARAEGWLDWWTGRVSFAEEAGHMDVPGEQTTASLRAKSLISSLERGMGLYHRG